MKYAKRVTPMHVYSDVQDPARLVELVHWNPNRVVVIDRDSRKQETWTPEEFTLMFEEIDMFPND